MQAALTPPVQYPVIPGTLNREWGGRHPGVSLDSLRAPPCPCNVFLLCTLPRNGWKLLPSAPLAAGRRLRPDVKADRHAPVQPKVAAVPPPSPRDNWLVLSCCWGTCDGVFGHLPGQPQ